MPPGAAGGEHVTGVIGRERDAEARGRRQAFALGGGAAGQEGLW